MGEVVEARLPGIARLLPPIAAYPAGPLLTGALRALARRKPGLFDRLGEYSKERYVIDPSDLGFAFTIVPDRERSFVSVVGKSDVAGAPVVVRGPILMLLGLLDGTMDGDALFFRRIVTISGRTDAVLALRNAIEDAELKPADLLGLTGALARIADSGILGGLDAARRILAAQPAVDASER